MSIIFDLRPKSWTSYEKCLSRYSSRQPGGCGLSWPEITVIKTDNIIVFQVVIWPVQLKPVNENLPLKEANFPA
ncbi:hypothetical protein, partial [Escherichia coli]|uniref:hypothetical protein n=3 Tax=Escherichia coli TaxID=562 RepID=UPI001BB1A038